MTRLLTSRFAVPGSLLVCVLAAFLLYANALPNAFIIDDAAAVTANPTVVYPELWKFPKVWVVDYWAWIYEDGRAIKFGDDRNLYRPVTVTVNMLNSLATGIGPARYRAVNILLYGLAAWLVGLWCGAWCGRGAGVVAGAVMVLHPLGTDVVNRIVGRADILCVIGIAGALWLQRRMQVHGVTRGRAIGAVLLAIVAAGSKESGVILMPLALAQSWAGAGGRSIRRALREDRGALAAVIAPVVALILLRLAVVGMPDYQPRPDWDVSDNPAFRLPWPARVPLALGLVRYYARSMVWPWPLFAYDQPLGVPGWSSPECWVGAAIAAALTLLVVRLLVRQRQEAVALLYWGGAVALVAQVLTPVGDYRAARMAYAILPAFAFLLGRIVVGSFWPKQRLRGIALGVLVVAGVASIMTISGRNVEFRDDLSLLEADVHRDEGRPSARIRLGSVYSGRGRYGEAEHQLLEAARLTPLKSEARFWLGRNEFRQKNYTGARDYYVEALARAPDNYQAMAQLALTLMCLNDYPAANEWITRAEALRPEHGEVRLRRVEWEMATGQFGRGYQRLRALLHEHPYFSPARQLYLQIEAERRKQS